MDMRNGIKIQFGSIVIYSYDNLYASFQSISCIYYHNLIIKMKLL